MTTPVPPKSQFDRLLTLLDHAYDAPFQPDNFHALMNAAHAFYYDEDSDDSVAAAASFDTDTALHSHLTRIEQLLVDRELENRSQAHNLNKPALVALLLDPETGMVEGNGLAQSFFDQRFPCPLSTLKLEKSSREELRQLAVGAAQNREFANRICMVRRVDDPAIHLAKCGVWINPEAPPDGQARGLAVSIAHFKWSADSLLFCQSMFGLTQSEASVLAALLNGASQAEIAVQRGRSAETVKAQAKSILRKTGCSRISEVMVLATTYGMLADAGTKPTGGDDEPYRAFTRPNRVITGDDGRTISYGIYGDPHGVPVLFVHGLLQGPFFPADINDRFVADGLCVIAPSRPGFGRTDRPADWWAFDESVVADALAVVRATTDKPLTIVAHQGGVSHACRIARALANQCKNMVMISAGVPIDEKKHIPAMGLQTRIAAIGVKHTPRLLETMIRIGIANELRKGIRPYLEHFFSNSPVDRDLLDDPRIYPVCEAGVLHMIDNGAKTIVHDGRAAMADWEADYNALSCPTYWYHGTQDPVMRYDFVEEFVANHGGAPVHLIDGAGITLHLAHSDVFTKAIADAAHHNPAG
ncbi:MAG: alpha/beta fold hydrolase [Ahrensia sp.]